MIPSLVGLLLVVAAGFDITVEWLPRDIVWLGGGMFIAAGAIVNAIERRK